MTEQAVAGKIQLKNLIPNMVGLYSHAKVYKIYKTFSLHYLSLFPFLATL